MEIQRLLTNVCSNDLAQSKAFYTQLFSFDVAFDSDWFVSLVSQGRALEIGIIDINSELVPEQLKQGSSGVYLTFVVEDVDALHEKVQTLNYTVIQPPQATFYGQNRMLIQAPEGTVCDVSSLLP